jgi:hypothetical protein
VALIALPNAPPSSARNPAILSLCPLRSSLNTIPPSGKGRMARWVRGLTRPALMCQHIPRMCLRVHPQFSRKEGTHKVVYVCLLLLGLAVQNPRDRAEGCHEALQGSPSGPGGASEKTRRVVRSPSERAMGWICVWSERTDRSVFCKQEILLCEILSWLNAFLFWE